MEWYNYNGQILGDVNCTSIECKKNYTHDKYHAEKVQRVSTDHSALSVPVWGEVAIELRLEG